MKNIKEYIMEAVESGKFDNTADSIHDLISNAPHLNICDLPNNIKDAFDNLSKSINIDNPFIYAKGETYFKMPYGYNDELQNICKTLDNIHVDVIDDKKVKVYYIDGKKYRIMETGSGSINKIPTDIQEKGTCLVFNEYMDQIQNGGDLSCIDDSNYIKSIIKDLFTGYKIDGSWIKSYSFQIKALTEMIKQIIEEIGGATEAYNYRIAKYGAISDYEHVSKAYTRMARAYAKVMGGRKDVFDPTDIILFDKTKVNSIVECCKVGVDEKECADIKDNFLRNCFNKRICMGISLKKLNKIGRIELYNTGNHNVVHEVTDYKLIDTKGKNNVTVLCEGEFNFDGVVDENGQPVHKKDQVILTMRTFGSGILAMDVTLSKNGKLSGPAIGKCPVDIWKKVINSKSKNISDNIRMFEKFITRKIDGDKDKVKLLISAAIKEGPHCFPFILLH